MLRVRWEVVNRRIFSFYMYSRQLFIMHSTGSRQIMNRSDNGKQEESHFDGNESVTYSATLAHPLIAELNGNYRDHQLSVFHPLLMHTLHLLPHLIWEWFRDAQPCIGSSEQFPINFCLASFVQKCVFYFGSQRLSHFLAASSIASIDPRTTGSLLVSAM